MLAAPRDGLSWGLRVADQVLGPLRSGRMHVIGARPASGKTTFLLGWLDRQAVFFTERSPQVARLSWAALRCGYEVDAVAGDDWGRLPAEAPSAVARELEWIAHVERHGWVTFYDLARPTVSAISALLADEAERSDGAGAQIVVFDYLQRVRPEGRQTKFDAVAEAAHLFQTVAVSLGVVVIVASQLKRKGDGVFDKYRPPNLEDFKLSGDIEEVADVALGFFRPLQQMTAKDEREVRAGLTDLERFKVTDVMAMKVVKHRWRGPANDRILWVRHADGSIEDMPVGLPPDAGNAWEPEEDRVPF